MPFGRIRVKPRLKRLLKGEGADFWCFYHKRFFIEGKKWSHCIPKGCYEFDHEYYLSRASPKQQEGFGLEDAG